MLTTETRQLMKDTREILVVVALVLLCSLLVFGAIFHENIEALFAVIPCL
jgi:hypothetical protein